MTRIDRLTLFTLPVVLGSGKRLFGGGTPSGAMRMVDHMVSSRGVIVASYEPAGAAKARKEPGKVPFVPSFSQKLRPSRSASATTPERKRI